MGRTTWWVRGVESGDCSPVLQGICKWSRSSCRRQTRRSRLHRFFASLESTAPISAFKTAKAFKRCTSVSKRFLQRQESSPFSKSIRLYASCRLFDRERRFRQRARLQQYDALVASEKLECVDEYAFQRLCGPLIKPSTRLTCSCDTAQI